VPLKNKNNTKITPKTKQNRDTRKNRKPKKKSAKKGVSDSPAPESAPCRPQRSAVCFLIVNFDFFWCLLLCFVLVFFFGIVFVFFCGTHPVSLRLPVTRKYRFVARPVIKYLKNVQLVHGIV